MRQWRVARWPARALPWLWLGLLAGCAEGGPQSPSDPGLRFEPTDPILLSTGSPTKDEDPSVLRARDGSLYVAWFSDRGSNPDIYITRTVNGREWMPPVRVTTDAGGDFNPSLIQDDQGVFHLAWFRWTAPFRGHILFNSSPDGLTWDPRKEIPVTTTDGVDDWVPTLTQAADGTLLVYFVSGLRAVQSTTSDLYLARRPPGASTWE
ncbi:MAG TPA: sialidase family protein, partial [Vicinamibacteria bacterium]